MPITDFKQHKHCIVGPNVNRSTQLLVDGALNRFNRYTRTDYTGLTNIVYINVINYGKDENFKSNRIRKIK